MAVLALLLSVVSAVTAIVAVAYTRSVASIERDRRHEETAPKFEAALEYRKLPITDGETVPMLVLTYVRGPGNLDDVSLRLVLTGQARPDPIVAICEIYDDPAEKGGIDAVMQTPLKPGEERVVRVALNQDGSGGRVPFHVRAERVVKRQRALGHRRDRWTSTVYCVVEDRYEPFAIVR